MYIIPAIWPLIRKLAALLGLEGALLMSTGLPLISPIAGLTLTSPIDGPSPTLGVYCEGLTCNLQAATFRLQPSADVSPAIILESSKMTAGL